MIGDDLVVDVLGAEKVGMQGIYFNLNNELNNIQLLFNTFLICFVNQSRMS